VLHENCGNDYGMLLEFFLRLRRWFEQGTAPATDTTPTRDENYSKYQWLYRKFLASGPVLAAFSIKDQSRAQRSA
jgi:hypothetical protein